MTGVNETTTSPTTIPPADGTDNNSVSTLPFSRSIRWMILGEQSLASLFLFLIVSTMGAQVFARYFFGAPISWSEEVARLALIWMTFIAAAFVMAEGR
ncbi:MAG: TRAP transporter small permease subunit, partial [Planctomicrobium sp.]|nr:TRAP transporter small permease subunit [Planctomicrobium sp.]